MPTKSAADLLDCGARSFDWRPYVKEGKLNAHHGDIKIEHEFEVRRERDRDRSIKGQGYRGTGV
jgi:hypothetical protein